VIDLNADGFTDFVYIRGGQLFVTSYRGRNGSGLSVFESWPSMTLSSVGGESVRSLAAIDLSQDGYPELVVETGKAVHFYLNKP
ncbi:MAG TPA: VCBS repeat-containing protein, partial [Pseudomonadota bacterium]|nr:VCBS repeat-containing protein [Pseudomonadota bacterium]